jgi:hypothetical protein
MCELWPGLEDNPFKIGERDLPDDIGFTNTFVGDGETAAGSIHLDRRAVLTAAIFEQSAALATK